MYVQYLLPAHPDIRVENLLSVPDAPDGEYQFAGVPDGIGAFRINPDDHSFEVVAYIRLRTERN